MDRQRQHVYQNPGPGSDPDESSGLYPASAGGTLQAVRGWDHVAQGAAAECEGTSNAQHTLEQRKQRPAQ